MDEIQKVLIKAGRKDLAQKYYEKVPKWDKGKKIGNKTAFQVKSVDGSKILSAQDKFFSTIEDIIQNPNLIAEKAMRDVEKAMAPLYQYLEKK